MGFENNSCHLCGVQLAPDDFDAVCSVCDEEGEEMMTNPDGGWRSGPRVARPTQSVRGWLGRLVTAEVRSYYAEHGGDFNLEIWAPVYRAARAGWRRGFLVGLVVGYLAASLSVWLMLLEP
jgi:hypothetical protein